MKIKEITQVIYSENCDSFLHLSLIKLLKMILLHGNINKYNLYYYHTSSNPM